MDVTEELLRKKKKREIKRDTRERVEENDEGDGRTNEKKRHEILSRMNQGAERVLFLARIYAPRRSSKPRWGVFRSRCG